MEAITRLVADSLARHGFDRPVDPRRLQWSRWFRCDSPHSLLTVPSKPGIFALSEEIMDLGTTTAHVATDRVGTDALVRPAATTDRVGRTLLSDSADTATNFRAAAPAATHERRMLAVIQFSEDDDMAFTLDRMFTRINPMRERLASGKCFLRFVVIEDQAQRRSICATLNQWITSSAEKTTSLEFTTDRGATNDVARAPSPAFSATTDRGGTEALVRPVATSDRVGRTPLFDSVATAQSPPTSISAALQSGAAKNLHCPHPLPSGF